MSPPAGTFRSIRRALRVPLAAAVLLLGLASPAFAGVGFGVTPTFPTTVTVGQTALPGSIQILNTSTPPESAGNATINSINLVPACATTSFVGNGDCPAASAAPGVFALSPTGTGEAGTACAGQTFTIAIIDPATGQVSFTPSSPVVLTPPTTNVRLDSINFVPSCGTTLFVAGGDCPAAQADPGVFQLSPTGTGEPGTACAGQMFTITTIDPATGQVTFTPSGGLVVLTPPGTANSVCRIDFTVGVFKAPTKAATTSPPGTIATAQIGFGMGTSLVTGATGTGSGSDFITVARATPTVTTTATPTATVGGPITDTAHLGAATPPGPAPTGTVTFTLFNTAACTGAPVFTSVVPVNAGTGNYTSAPFSPTVAGTYRWIAAYSGDANNLAVTTACGDAGENTT